MLARITIIIFILIICLNGFSQSNFSDSINSPKTIYRLRILPPGINLESKIGKHTTMVIDLLASPTLSYKVDDQNEYYDFNLRFTPSIVLSPRFFMDIDKRNESNKRTDYFSGWYFGIPLIISYKELYLVGGNAGFQGSIRTFGYWNFNFGIAGGIINGKKQLFTPIGDVAIGINLN